VAFKIGSLFYDIFARTDKLRNSEQEVDKSTKQMGRSFGRLQSIIAAVFSAEVLRRVTLSADQFQLLQARIDGAARSTRDAAKAQDELVKISARTGTQLKANVRLFESFTIAAEDLGRSNDEVLQLVDTVQQLGVLSGASVDEINNASRQLSQGLAAGIVRAEEFNSVIENTPRVAQAIADGLGMSFGQMRKLVLEGKLLSDDVFEALLSQTENVQKRFAEMPVDIMRATTVFTTFATRAVSELDESRGLTEAIAAGILEGAEFMRDDFVPLTQEALGYVEDIAKAFGLATDDIDAASGAADGFAQVLEIGKNIVGFVLDGILKLPINLRVAFGIAAGEVDNFTARVVALKDIASSVFKFLAFSIKNFFSLNRTMGTEQNKIAGQRLENAIRAAREERDTRIQANREAIDAAIKDGKRLTAELEKQQQKRNTSTRSGRTPRAPGTRRPPPQRRAPDAPIVSDVDKLRAQLGNEEQAILNAMEERKAKILEATDAEGKERRELMLANERLTNAQLKAVQVAGRETILQGITALNEDIMQVLKSAGKEQTALSKALFVTNRAIQVAGIIANTELQAAQAATQGGGGLFGIPAAQLIRASGYARAGIVAGLTVAELGGGRRSGGQVSSNLMHPVAESGDPELFIKGSKQFLIPGQGGGQVVPMTQGAGGGGGVNINIVNEGTPKDATVNFVSRDEVRIMMKDAQADTVRRIDDSLASGRGSTAKALNTGFRASRNL
jgi:tape measure domain-containing protein